MRLQEVLSIILASLFVIFVVAHASRSSEAESYWGSLMGGEPMPAPIKNLLSPEWVDDWGVAKAGEQQKRIEDACFFYFDEPDCEASSVVKGQYDPTINLFFLEKELKLGTTNKFHFIKTSNYANFLPRKASKLIPLSSSKITEVMDALFIKPLSAEAKEMRNTVAKCEAPPVEGEEKSCVSSLEAMLDFSTSKLGNNVEALVSEIGQETTKPQAYTVVGLKSARNSNSVACHKERYPYAVYNCHTTRTKAYRVSLVGADGSKIKAVAACHHDTSAWSPNHLAFYELKVKPGTVPVCHFMPGDHIVWIPK